MKITLLTLSLTAFLFTFSTQTFAADFTVNLTTDEHDANTADGNCDIDTATVGLQCTLRAAVEQANALASDDNVSFDNLPANSIITLTTANGGEIRINNNGGLTINGLGANLLTIDGGAGTNRIFSVEQATVTISGVTLTGGNGRGALSDGAGGAIFAVTGSLTLDRVHVRDNTARQGGGVTLGGTSTPGGSGTYRITNSTFFGNAANVCGAIDNNNGKLTVDNSTVSFNTADSGGGFCNFLGTTRLRNVTITNNIAEFGGGISVQLISSNFPSELYFINTIVAGNIGTNSAPEIRFSGGTLISEGNNLVGDSAGDSTNTGANTITYQSTDIRDVNPLLGPLQNNGGTTPTHALLANSPAIDAGNNCVFLATCPSGVPLFALLTDQRGEGFTRNADGNGDTIQVVDIGAFEVQLAPTAAGVLAGGRVTTADGRGIPNVRVTITDLNGASRSILSNALGYYSFDDVQAGETYVFSVSHKRYTFYQSTQVHSIFDEMNDVNFVGMTIKLKRRI